MANGGKKMVGKPGNRSLLADLSNELSELSTKAGQYVVRVNARRRLPGSGIVWSTDGVVVTADHVIEVEEGITVELPDGREVPAKLVGRDPSTDVAVLRVSAAKLASAQLAHAGSAKVGSLVLAIGRNVEGGLMASLGMINMRTGPLRTWRGGLLESLIQTDVAMYPGLSGGPLLDAAGHVAGLSSSLFIKGAGAAVPVEVVERVVQTLLTQGRIRRGYLGVSSHQVALPPELVHRLDPAQNSGLLVVGVEPGSPANQGGLMLGDVIVGLAGQPTRNGDELQGLLGPERVGAPTPVKLIRGGELRELTLTVGEQG